VVTNYGGWKWLLWLGQFVIMRENVKLHATVVSSAYKTVPKSQDDKSYASLRFSLVDLSLPTTREEWEADSKFLKKENYYFCFHGFFVRRM